MIGEADDMLYCYRCVLFECFSCSVKLSSTDLMVCFHVLGLSGVSASALGGDVTLSLDTRSLKREGSKRADLGLQGGKVRRPVLSACVRVREMLLCDHFRTRSQYLLVLLMDAEIIFCIE